MVDVDASGMPHVVRRMCVGKERRPFNENLFTMTIHVLEVKISKADRSATKMDDWQPSLAEDITKS